MNKLALIVVLLAGGVAAAQGSGQSAPASVPVPPSEPSRSPAELHKICADAMNADPEFAKSIVKTVDKQLDQQTIDAHDAAIKNIGEKESHVIYAYGALWVLVAMLVGFMWMRQQKLKGEIEALRRDLTKAES